MIGGNAGQGKGCIRCSDDICSFETPLVAQWFGTIGADLKSRGASRPRYLVRGLAENNRRTIQHRQRRVGTFQRTIGIAHEHGVIAVLCSRQIRQRKRHVCLSRQISSSEAPLVCEWAVFLRRDGEDHGVADVTALIGWLEDDGQRRDDKCGI